MPRHLRTTLLLAAAVALPATVAGCGDSVPSNGVAKVGGTVITKASFNHWLTSLAKQQAQGQPGAAVPDPPSFTNCIAAKGKQPVPKGAQKPPVSQLRSQCKQAYDGLKQQTMQFLISAEWLQQESKAKGVKVTDAQVQKTFEDQKKQAFPKEADYKKFLTNSGRTEADLIFQVKLSVLTNQLQAKVVEGKGTVTKAQIASYYAKNKQRFAQPESRDLLVVLTKDQGKANQALGELKKHKPWAAVVKKYSVDTASKAQGGKLPGVTKGTQEKAFDTAIFKAKKGQVQGPVKTQFGYYVFQVSKVTPATQQTLAQASQTITNLLKSQTQQKALNDFVKKFQKDYRAKTFCASDFKTSQCKNGPKPTTAAPGGAQPGQPQGAPPSSGGAQGAPQQAPQGAPQQAPQGAPQQAPQGAPQQAPQGTPQQGAPPQGTP